MLIYSSSQLPMHYFISRKHPGARFYTRQPRSATLLVHKAQLLCACFLVAILVSILAVLRGQSLRTQSSTFRPAAALCCDKEVKVLNDTEVVTTPIVPLLTQNADSSIHGSDDTNQSERGRDAWSDQQQRRFEVALGQVVELLPGEMKSRNLLQPIEGTGAAKLHEIGLRVRHYSKFLKAWEELHIFHGNGDGTYILDNIIQHIYCQARIASSESGRMHELNTVVHTYEAYRDFMMKFGQLLFPWTKPYSTSHMALHNQFRNGGRGIVLTAGDAQAEFLMTGIPLLRKLGCMLPIEVMYLGDEDLDEDNRSQLEALGGVITRDMKPMINDNGWKLAGWAAKPFAILFSSFREIVFIDADSLFFQNPEVLFHEPAYTRTGALFFKDRSVMPESKREWLQQLVPKPISAQVKSGRFWTGDSGHMQDSGVLVIDKWRHFIALLVVARMNGPERDGNSAEGGVGVSDMVYGEHSNLLAEAHSNSNSISRGQGNVLDRLGARQRFGLRLS